MNTAASNTTKPQKQTAAVILFALETPETEPDADAEQAQAS
jgi:hypothetical protein